MTRRCLLIAWRVTSDPVVSLAIESGPSSHSRPTRRSRVSSPRDAKTRADAFELLLRIPDVLVNRLHHQGPAAVVVRKRLRAAFERYAVEAGFDDRQPDSVAGLFNREDDE